MQAYFEFLWGVLSRRTRLVLLVASVFTLVLTALGVAEDLYVNHSFEAEERSRLQETISKVSAAMTTHGRLDLQAYRQTTDLGPTDVIVLTRDNELVDAEGDDIAGIFLRAAVPPLHNGMARSELGEKWYILKRNYRDGQAFVGTYIEPNAEVSDYAEILTDVKSFGQTFTSASSVKSRDFSNTTSGIVVIDDLANVRAIFGGIPTKVELRLPGAVADGELTQMKLAAGRYSILAAHPLPFGLRVIAIDDTTDQQTVASSYRMFNIFAGSTTWVLLVASALAILLRYEILLRRQELPLADALKSGETEFVEFKEGFIDAVIARSITAFSNTNYGNIFVGVTDRGEVVGINETDAKAQDLLLQRLRNLTAQRIKPPVFVRATFLHHEGRTVLRIFVPRGIEPFYTFENVAYIRNLTSVMKAETAQLMELIKHSRSTFSA